MASLVIAALPVHAAATILLAATSKSPIKAATTDVREDDFLRLPIGNVAIASLRKMRGYLELVAGLRRGNSLPRIADHRTIGVCILATARDLRRANLTRFPMHVGDSIPLIPNAGPDSIKKSPSRGGIASMRVGRVGTFVFSSQRISRTRRKGALTITARLLCAPAPQERDGERSDCQQGAGCAEAVRQLAKLRSKQFAGTRIDEDRAAAEIRVRRPARPLLRNCVLSPQRPSSSTPTSATAKTFALRPSKLLGDSAYGSAEMLGWLVDELGIEPCSTNRRAMMAPSRVRTSTMIRPATFISALAAGR
jgi:hypothetical protein